MNNLVGLTGGPSKCARFYTEMVDCAKEAGRNDYLWKCKLEREDYLECLHNKKTAARMERIQREKKRLIKEGKWPPKAEDANVAS